MSKQNGKTVNCTQEVMNTCAYARKYNGSTVAYCDYICKTGHRRGCLPQCCDKYESRMRNKSRKIHSPL